MTESDDRALLPFEHEGARLIRRQWHNGQWYFSVIDVVRVLTDNDAPRRYWSDLKRKLREEGFELYDKIVQLKMRAPDGKMRETDAAVVETMLRIVQSIPSPRAEPIKQWLAQEGARRLEEVAGELPEAQRRLLIRGEVAEKNTTLHDAAQGAGVLSPRDFGLFTDAGYKGLYAGEGENDIHARKGLRKGEKILDWMSSEELAANLFRITQTEAKLRRDPTITTKEQANQTHHQIGAAVRQVILDLGNTPPEQLPTPAQSIKQIERSEQKRIEGERQPSLFGFDAPEGEGE
jgi:DNA-damage-inducible protein D